MNIYSYVRVCHHCSSTSSRHHLYVCVYVCVQACRGSSLDPGVEVETDCVDSSEDEGVFECQSVPDETVVAYATAPGKTHKNMHNTHTFA